MNSSVFIVEKIHWNENGPHVTGRRSFVSDSKRSARESGQGTLVEERSVRESNVFM